MTSKEMIEHTSFNLVGGSSVFNWRILLCIRLCISEAYKETQGRLLQQGF